MISGSNAQLNIGRVIHNVSSYNLFNTKRSPNGFLDYKSLFYLNRSDRFTVQYTRPYGFLRINDII